MRLSTKCLNRARGQTRRNLATVTSRQPRSEGTIASVFASLSGEKPVPLPERFKDLKREIIHTESLQQAVKASWTDLLHHLDSTTKEIIQKKQTNIPSIRYQDLTNGLSQDAIDEIKKRGTVIVREVVPEGKALEWLDRIKSYIALNPHVKGFPEKDKAVFEIYWSAAQLEARSHPGSQHVQSFLLSLFNKASAPDNAISLDTPMTYCDRLRIRNPGDSAFALGPHCDGGSVERWEDATYRKSYQSILEGKWRDHDAWDIAGRADANMNMYDGAGACGVFRALQGWTSLSKTGPGEGTLKVFPAIKESSSYLMLRPFFKPIVPRLALSQKDFLHSRNWELDLDSTDFPNSPLGRSQELNDSTHPHLRLDETMTALPTVNPGDQAWWHCDGVHSVESSHKGTSASSVLYIPSVPLTVGNARYVKEQLASYRAFIPPPDFPGGVGESDFRGQAGDQDILSDGGRQGMGIASFRPGNAKSDAEWELMQQCNSILGN